MTKNSLSLIEQGSVKKIKLLVFIFFLFILKITAQEKSQNPLFGKNLIINGGAEAGEAAWRGEGFESARYGSFGGEWDIGVAGAPNGGDSYFRLTASEGKESVLAKHVIDLTRLAEFLDKTAIDYTLSGYIGGSPTKEEKFATTSLIISFLDMDKKLLGSSSLEVKETELPKAEVGSSSMILRTKTDKMPKGTRVIEITLKVKNACLNCLSIGYAENLSLIFKEVK
ncbi:MAG: hypothetical protein HY819_08465 [Acidobacteria bacterium]|nr:hypothetical protein [Acidobacteriota bacterium]